MNRTSASKWLLASALTCTSPAWAQTSTIDPAAKVVVMEAPKGPLETTDGSGQIGYIVAELQGGQVLFRPCKGDSVEMDKNSLRETQVPCDEQPGAPPSKIWVWTPAAGDLAIARFGGLSGEQFLLSCRTLPAQVSMAMVDVAAGKAAPGTVYSSDSDNTVKVISAPSSGSGSTEASVSADPCAPSAGVAALSITAQERKKLLDDLGLSLGSEQVLTVFRVNE